MFSASLYDPDRLRCTPSLWYNLMLMDLFFILQQESLSTNNSILPTFNSDITRGSQQRTDTRPTFRENRGQFHKQNNTNNMEYYNIRHRDMGRNDVWDMSRDDVWDMSRDDVWDMSRDDVCCGCPIHHSYPCPCV
jgi:hypothetical protein